MDRLTVLEIFVKVVEEESFTDAAQTLGISKSHCSKQIRQLEDRLGARLVNRTTRQISPTDVGRTFYSRCVQILEDLQEAERTVGQMQHQAMGTLRLNVPLSFGLRHLIEPVSAFMAEYPDLQVDLSLSDQRVDIVEEGFDVSIRVGTLQDSSMIARKLAPARHLLCASPTYLEQHGSPESPRALKDHSCLLYRYLATGSTWHFKHTDGGEEAVRVSGRMRSDNGDALVAAAVSGMGFVYVPDFLVADELRDKKLVCILPEWCRSRDAVWAIYPHARHLSVKVRLFIDFLVEEFSPSPPWQMAE
ncbi:MAG: LysR family transcriptional regulator [Myxococcota bacterium]